jgi:hypothetical protein
VFQKTLISGAFLLSIQYLANVMIFTRMFASPSRLHAFRRLAAGVFVSVFAVLGTGAGFAQVDARDSLMFKLNEARSLNQRAAGILDSLRGGLARLQPGAPGVGALGLSREDSVIWHEVIAERKRRRELEEAFDYRALAVGYILNPNLALGMNVLGWHGDFGARVDGRVLLGGSQRAVGVNASLLYAVHEFYLAGEQMFTRLYLFGGSGYYWERIPGGSGGWYDTPNRAVRGQFGAGTELGLREIRGTRFTPEIGFQGSRFYTRYNDSRDYSGGRPASDYSLYPYYALHFSFYFL